MTEQAQVGEKSGFLTMMLAWGGPFLLLFGLHRIYTGHVGIGLAQFFTLGGCGVWQLIDIISIITRKFRDKNGFALKQDHPLRRLAK